MPSIDSLSDAARWVRPEQVADRSEVTWLRVVGLLYQHPSLRAMAWFRFASWAHERHVRVVPSAVERRIQRLYGLEMVAGSDIGGGLYIAHPVGCTIVVESMGANVSVMANVTTGRRQEHRWPRIGDRVFIGAGARILGPICRRCRRHCRSERGSDQRRASRRDGRRDTGPVAEVRKSDVAKA